MTAQRFPQLDAMRGIALFGILLVNAPFFLMPEGSFGTYALQKFPGWHNRAAEFITSWLFDAKFILIFSFLFGWGLHTQMQRGEGFERRYFLRMLGLLIIGLMHAVFLFVGDILVTYAVLGVALFLMRDWSSRKLLIAAGVLWVVSIVAQAALGALVLMFPESLANYSQLVQLHRYGSFIAITEQRIEDVIGLYMVTPFLFMPQVLGMFCAGLAAAKTYGPQGNLEAAKPLARQVLKWLWLPALALNALYAVAMNSLIFNAAIGLGMRGAFAPLLTAVYMSAAVFLFSNSRAALVSKIFAGEGRMSLSIYIGESVVMGFIALSYGLGMYGLISPSVGIALCVAVYAVLLLLASLWRKVFALGPMEWVLRSITEGGVVGTTLGP
jgi:uncharacterized protein